MQKLKFTEVVERHRSILIVGTGISAKRLVIPRDRDFVVIGVNRAIYDHDIDYWFTLDPNNYNARIMKEKPKPCKYYAAVPADYGTPEARSYAERQKPQSGINYLVRVAGSWAGRLMARPKLSENPAQIHTGNSGWGALGLAYHMQPDKIAMIGFEADQVKLAHLPRLFATAKSQLQEAGIDIRLASGSRIKSYPQSAPEELIAWLNQQ